MNSRVDHGYNTRQAKPVNTTRWIPRAKGSYAKSNMVANQGSNGAGPNPAANPKVTTRRMSQTPGPRPRLMHEARS